MSVCVWEWHTFWGDEPSEEGGVAEVMTGWCSARQGAGDTEVTLGQRSHLDVHFVYIVPFKVPKYT